MPMSARTQAAAQFQQCTINRIENRVVVPAVAWVPPADTGRKMRQNKWQRNEEVILQDRRLREYGWSNNAIGLSPRGKGNLNTLRFCNAVLISTMINIYPFFLCVSSN